jgi:hypothetical protein
MPYTPLDSLIARLKSPDVVMTTDIDPRLLADGLEDLRNRMSHAEHSHLRTLHETRGLSDRLVTAENNINGITNDRDEFRRQVKTATDLPQAHEKKIEDLEQRVRACEGAVGTAPFKAAEPIKPEKDGKQEAKPHPIYDAPPPKNPPLDGPMPTNTPFKKAPEPIHP